MSYNNTSSENRQARSGLADKTSSVFHLAHGAGENLRGTLLGAIDTVAKSSEGEAKNDAIATKGRAEMSKALEVLKAPMSESRGGYNHSNYSTQTGRNTGRHTGPYTGTTNTAGNYQSSAYADPGNMYPEGGTVTEPTSVGATGPVNDHGSTFPNHHRDDAIAGLPPNQVQNLQGLGQKREAQVAPDHYNSGGYGNYAAGNQQNYGAQSGYPNDSHLR